MAIKGTHDSWGGGAVLLHWIMAIAVFGLFGLGLWMTSLGYYDYWYKQGPYIHKSIGLTLFAVLLLRLLWRRFNPPPAPLENHAAWEQRVAHGVHLLLYLLLLSVMLSGYFISTADGRAISVFNWFEVPAIPLNIDQQEEVAGAIHFYLASTAMVLVALHMMGALKHHFFDKDETLRRMLRLK